MLISFLFQEDDFEKQCLLMDHYRNFKKEIAGQLELNCLFCVGRTADRSKMELKIERIIRLFERGYVQG